MNNISYNKAQSTLQMQAKYTETLTTFETQAGDLQKDWVPAILGPSHLPSTQPQGAMRFSSLKSEQLLGPHSNASRH